MPSSQETEWVYSTLAHTPDLRGGNQHKGTTFALIGINFNRQLSLSPTNNLTTRPAQLLSPQ